MLKLFHYCCSHSKRAITDRGFLIPNGVDIFGVGLVWLTDQETPDREGLGLTSHIQPCDRLEHQYVARVQRYAVEQWMESDIRARLSVDPTFHEFEDGRQPETWWIARTAIYAERNRHYAPPRQTNAVA